MAWTHRNNSERLPFIPVHHPLPWLFFKENAPRATRAAYTSGRARVPGAWASVRTKDTSRMHSKARLSRNIPQPADYNLLGSDGSGRS